VTLGDNRISGDVLSVSNANASFADKNAGIAKLINVGGIGVTGADSNNYTLFSTSTTATANVTARALTVNAAGNNKVYDGTTTATVTFGDNRIVGDNLTFVSTSTFGDKNVGTGKVVNVSGIGLTGADAGNYTVTSSSLSTLANITARALTVSVIGNNRVYDGTTTATVTLSDNRVVGDDLTIASTSTFADKNVGTGKVVSVSGIGLSGVDAGNYTFASSSLSTLANITARALTVSAIGNNKVYDGTTTATVTLGDNRISGDVLSVSNANASFADKNAGIAKLINVGGIGVTGADSNNYTLFSTSTTATANVTARALTVNAAGNNKVYDGTTSATISFTGDNRIAGDALVLSSPLAFFSDKNVGTGKQISALVALSGADAMNYALTNGGVISTFAEIAAKGLNIFASGNNKLYDGTTLADVDLNINGVVGSENVDLNYAAIRANFDNKNAGTNKTVTVTGVDLTGFDAANYVLNTTTLTTTADINRRSFLVTATGMNKVYDGTNNAIVTLSDNRIVGDNVTANYNEARFSNRNAGFGKGVLVTGISLTGADEANYILSNPTTTTSADIIPKPITVNVSAIDKVYDGSSTATVSATSSGILSGDVVQFGVTNANFNNKNVGINKLVTANGVYLSGGADFGNYNIVNTDVVTTTASITPKDLLVKANDASKFLDSASYSGGNGVGYSGFVGGENASVLSGSVSYGGTSQGAVAAGTYSIIPSGLSAQNYKISYLPGTLTINAFSAVFTSTIYSSLFGSSPSSFTIASNLCPTDKIKEEEPLIRLADTDVYPFSVYYAIDSKNGISGGQKELLASTTRYEDELACTFNYTPLPVEQETKQKAFGPLAFLWKPMGK
jgi:hypothetical protein